MLATAQASDSARLIVNIFIPSTIGIIMLTMGLGLRVKDFMRIITEPLPVILGSVNQIIVLPAVGFALAYAFQLPAPLAVGLILLTACPGGPSSNLYSNLARGDTALSVSLTAISGAFTVVSIPIVAHLALKAFPLELAGGGHVSLPIGETMLKIVLVVGVPLALGMFIRAKSNSRADSLEPKLKIAAVVLLAILVVGAIAKEWTMVSNSFGTIGIPVVALSFGTMLIGFFSARIARLKVKQAITITIEVGMQNAALAIGLATAGMGRDDVAMPAVIYGIVAYFTCAAALVAGRMLIPATEAEAPSAA